MNRFKDIFEIFNKGNKNLYFVGGCVRDSILGITPKDFDFTTDALPDETIKFLESAGLKPWPLGEKFGTIAVKFKGEQVEITTHRSDITSGRHPEVSFTKDIKKDLERRDFTINSMAMDSEGKIIDLFGGLDDIKNKIIRTTGSPSARFSEDSLRMLRAGRFAAKLKFSIEEKTFEAMYENAHSILSVSKERFFEEMTKLIMSDYPLIGLDYIAASRILFFIIPEFISIYKPYNINVPSKNLWIHISKVLEQSPKTIINRWSALLHDIAKPQTRMESSDTVHFYGHDILGAEMADNICRRLKMSNELRKSVVGIIRLHHRFNLFSKNEKLFKSASKKAIKRLIRDCDKNNCNINDLLELFRADVTSTKESVRVGIEFEYSLIKQALAEMSEEDLRPQLPKNIGNKIMEKFNLEPSKEVGDLKRKLDVFLLNGKITSNMTIEEILNLLK